MEISRDGGQQLPLVCEPDQLATYLESFHDSNWHLFPSADFLLESPAVGCKRTRDEQLEDAIVGELRAAAACELSPLLEQAVPCPAVRLGEADGPLYACEKAAPLPPAKKRRRDEAAASPSATVPHTPVAPDTPGAFQVPTSPHAASPPASPQAPVTPHAPASCERSVELLHSLGQLRQAVAALAGPARASIGQAFARLAANEELASSGAPRPPLPPQPLAAVQQQLDVAVMQMTFQVPNRRAPAHPPHLQLPPAAPLLDAQATPLRLHHQQPLYSHHQSLPRQSLPHQSLQHQSLPLHHQSLPHQSLPHQPLARRPPLLQPRKGVQQSLAATVTGGGLMPLAPLPLSCAYPYAALV